MHAVVHPGTQIDQSIRFFDQSSQDVRREHIDGEYARHAGLGLNSPWLAITDPSVVDHGVEAPEFVDRIRDALRAGYGGQFAQNGN